ncbi:hypothetical protein Q3G72_023855 [Acer saccharum]|nr:hypothetical protein Q3G72_023855 [Acer saccharum]
MYNRTLPIILQSSIAKLFKESSLEESEHAHKLMEYQCLPQFLSSPPSSFVRCIVSAATAISSLHHRRRTSPQIY